MPTIRDPQTASMEPSAEKLRAPSRLSHHSQRNLALAILAAVLIVNAVGLWPELTISRVDLNDNVFHYPLVVGTVDAIQHGHDPFDWWANEWDLGYPVMRTYQGLGHLLTAVVYFALFKSVSLMTVFIWVRFLSVLLVPLTFFITARLLSLSWLTAAAAAILAPLVSSSGLYGLEYGSYLWAGTGLFTQAVASHFLLLTIGFAYRALKRGVLVSFAGLLLGLTFLAHFIYGYMGALTICLLALLPDREVSRATRIGRTLWIAAVSLAIAAFQLIPMLRDGAIINHSRWENSWKWDSFGAPHVLKLLFSGDVLDHDRLPALSLLVLVGLYIYFRDHHALRLHYPARTFIASGAALWILMFFGRPFWGPLLTILGVSPDMQLHRVVGGAQLFLVLLAAIGLAAIWRMRVAAAVVVTAILLWPMIAERSRYLKNDNDLGRANLATYDAHKADIDMATSIARNRGGRAYAGLPLTWGGPFKVGDMPFYHFLSIARVPALSFMYHSMSLPSEVMTRLNDRSEAEYKLFNLRTVIAPYNLALPAFLTRIRQAGSFQVLVAPGNGYFDVVDAFYAVKTNRDDFYDINDRWLQSYWVPKNQHLLLDFFGNAPPMARLAPGDPLPAASPFPPPGTVEVSGIQEDAYYAVVDASRAGFILFKMTWHPSWLATLDGRHIDTVMLSPGFVGVPVGPGHHLVQIRYQPGPWKAILAMAGFLIAGLLFVGERRGIEIPVARVLEIQWPKTLTVAAGWFLLALPVALALFTGKISAGHDAFEYLPRQVEFHQNIMHGIFLPRWAPDLSSGAGQPLFLFNPPMFYYLAEIWKLLGFDFVWSINLACVLIVLASAAGMFLLGWLYFGDLGGWLAAAAYVYAPYFAVNLYVRSALAEYAAFPFFAFALYGFGAYAKHRRMGHLLTGAAGFAGVLLCHNAAALLFAPLLAGFILFGAYLERSWSILRREVYALFLALGLSAFVWLPALAMNQDVQVRTLLRQGYALYANHFVYLHQLFASPWGYGLSVPGDQDGMSFSLGWSHLLLIAIAALALWRLKLDRRWLCFFAFSGAILCVMILPIAQPIWDRVLLLQYLAFPWRWLGPIAVCVAMSVASIAPAIASLERSQRRWAMAGVMVLLIVPNLSHLHPQRFEDVDLSFWTPQQIAARRLESTTWGEYRPRWMLNWPDYNSSGAQVISGTAAIVKGEETPVRWSGLINASSPSTVQVWRAYFPGWQLRIDGTLAALGLDAATGLIRFQIPAGEHQVTLAWRRTGFLWISDLISILALFIFAGLAGRHDGKARDLR